MKRSNVTRFDSKGRLLIPSHLRKSMRAREGTDVVIIPEEDKRQVRIIPMVKGRTAEIRLLIEDVSGSLARIAKILSKSGLDIIVSESRTLEKGRLAEWEVMVDTSGCNDLDRVGKSLQELENVRKMEILRDE
jgi:bifunctional DNA-binding transcriptional regulator/antitoxin component of YhaV-PrlF toxin-antitoxin module